MTENTIRMDYIVPTYTGYLAVFTREFKNKKSAVQYIKRNWFADLKVDEEDSSITMTDIKTGNLLKRWIYTGKEFLTR